MAEFIITKFGRHEDGYFHARVTMAGERTLYLHRKFGSWMAPGKEKGREVLKEPEALGITFAAKLELEDRVRKHIKKERPQEEVIQVGASADSGAVEGADLPGESGA